MLRYVLFLCCLAAALSLSANNIEVTNISLTDQDAGTATTKIQFDLSWENSWRISVGPANYDAAWVFAKYRIGGGPWQHAELSGATAPAGATVDVADGKGAFVYRAADGSGDVAYTGLQLDWDYGTDGVDQSAVVDVQVFAIEMVYVPEGAFEAGMDWLFSDEDPEVGSFYISGPVSGITRGAYPVNSEDAITVGTGLGNLYYQATTATPGDQAGPIPAAFPKGFAAFYTMKYEMSQAQYVAFFNTLTQEQKETLDLTAPANKNSDEVVARNAVAWSDAGNATTSLPDVACAYTWPVLTSAYLDWAALRPLTELEYEKSARGPAEPVKGELAWGNANVFSGIYELLDAGTPSEQVSNMGQGTGNALLSSTDGTIGGPVRCGALAASAVNPTREETGGSYYGVMELSGNVYERVITVGNPEGRAFTGNHGDGELANDGEANVAGWPADAAGYGYRGAAWINSSNFARVSDRFDAASIIASGNNRLGFRGGRTAE